MKRLAPLLILVCAASCITVVRTVRVTQTRAPETPVTVTTSAKAHLADGSVIMLTDGFEVLGDSLTGRGVLYDLDLMPRTFAGTIALDSVVAIESFSQKYHIVGSVIGSVLGTAAAAFGTAALMVAMFGSCPTFYAIGPDEAVLQAEGFSYSIAPVFEQRDLDRIDVGTGSSGHAVLELRNEALETHYINEIKLIAVPHGPGEAAYPMGDDELLVVTDDRAPSSASSLLGERVTQVVAAADSSWYDTSEKRLDTVDANDLTDRLDLVWPAPEAENAALVLRMRNSLLTTILLYDYMLARQGASSIDWLANGLAQPGTALEIGAFFRRHMGVRILVRSGAAYREVGRLPDVGPIAWEEVALEIPVLETDSVRVRLEFVADGWRFDRIALATMVRRVKPDEIPVLSVEAPSGESTPDAVLHLGSPDEEYLVTGPGMRYVLTFDAMTEPNTSYALVTQGYYTEWVRGSWLRDNPTPRPLELSDALLAEVIHDWQRQKPVFERRFYDTRIPVR